MKRGTITFARSAIDPNSKIDSEWLLAQIYETRRTIQAHGYSLAASTTRAFAVYNDDLKRLMPEAFRDGDAVIAIVSGIGEMRSPHVDNKNVLNLKGELIT